MTIGLRCSRTLAFFPLLLRLALQGHGSCRRSHRLNNNDRKQTRQYKSGSGGVLVLGCELGQLGEL
jgi:hypothetical protein